MNKIHLNPCSKPSITNYLYTDMPKSTYIKYSLNTKAPSQP